MKTMGDVVLETAREVSTDKSFSELQPEPKKEIKSKKNIKIIRVDIVSLHPENGV
ncbi:MAG: hypothetical protein ACRCUY_04360 [Thermoguttaceae bacterium]